MPLACLDIAPVHGQRAVALNGPICWKVVRMSIAYWVARVACVLSSFRCLVVPRRLSREEAHLIEYYRTLSEQDRIALRYLCTAYSEMYKF